MDSDSELPSMPTLGLVGSTGKVEKPLHEDKFEKVKAPCLVAVSSMEVDSGSEEGGNHEQLTQVDGDNSHSGEANQSVLELENEGDSTTARPRLTTTLLIFKRPSDTGDYMIANPPEEENYDDEYLGHPYKKKKKKKKKRSKESVLAMDRSNAQKLLEIQKSISKLTSRYQVDTIFDDRDRRRRAQSSSYLSGNDSNFSGLRSPPLTAPILGQLPSFPGFKGQASLYRRRQLSTGSLIAENKRRFTRKKRWESEETRSSGIATPTIEATRKGHLSENNVWTPMDDYRLLINIVQTKGNLEHVFAGTKFSCFYTFDEVAHRWETLLYDVKAGPLSQQAISNLHPLVRSKIQSEALFSEDEENLLRTIKTVSGITPELNGFVRLLEENPQVFTNRTARQLLLHWMEMKTFHLLDGQDVRDYKDPFNLFALQDNAYLASVPDMSILHELQTESKLVKHQIRQLEEEVESWHCMQELVVSDGSSDRHSMFSLSDFDDQTYAILRGKHVHYCMRSKEILIGRHSTNNKVDADLTLEGASGKVSRRQAIIQMREFGEFYIINQGRHSIFVDSLHVPFGGMAKLTDGCVIQITHINLVFKVNEKLIKEETALEIKNEVINARLKTYDTLSSPSYSSSVLKTPGLGTETFASPSSVKFKSPRKRSISSTNSSPISGAGSSVSSSLGVPRAVRPTKSGVGNIISGPSTLLPFSTGDLTIRPTSQPQSPSPFMTEASSKTQVSKSFMNDSDVFKKPAPVTPNRTPSKLIQSPGRTIPMSDLVFSSAFAAVGSSQMLPSSNVYSMQNENAPESADNNANASHNPTPPASLPPASSLMDYSKLGLSSDITVTHRLTPTTAATSVASNSAPPPVSDPSDEPRTPSLGLVKIDSDTP